MRRYNQRLFRITRAILLNDDEAEDVIQDAYLRAYGALDQFAGRAKFSTWLTKIAIYEALNRLRKRKREQEFPDSPDQPNQGIESVKSSEPDPEQQALRYEAATFLEQAVDVPCRTFTARFFVLREIRDPEHGRDSIPVLDRAGCNARSSGKRFARSYGDVPGYRRVRCAQGGPDGERNPDASSFAW